MAGRKTHGRPPRVPFRGERMLVLGAGSIATTFLPMLFQQVSVKPEQVRVASDDHLRCDEGVSFEVGHEHFRLTVENYASFLADRVSAGDCVVNLTGGVAARDLIKWCLNHDVNYIDTSNERWEFGALYGDADDYAASWRGTIACRDTLPKRATAMVSHGANPGIVSHFAKQAVVDLAREEGIAGDAICHDQWGRVAQALGICAFHISERDTQKAKSAPPNGVLQNTWSIEGFLEEALSRPCFAWGSHEQTPCSYDVRRDRVYDVVTVPGLAKDCAIQSWLPSFGAYEGRVIPHEEAFSIAELFTTENGGHRYQPTVLFPYHPCETAHRIVFETEEDAEALKPEVMTKDVAEGFDELGILVLREGSEEVYWYGSKLGIDEARSLVPQANATTMQVAAGLLGGLCWVLENPGHGLVSAEFADHERVLEIAEPYLGTLHGVYGIWDNTNQNWQTSELICRFGDV